MDRDIVRHRSTGQSASGGGDEKHTKNVVDEPEEETGDAGYIDQHRHVLIGVVRFIFN